MLPKALEQASQRSLTGWIQRESGVYPTHSPKSWLGNLLRPYWNHGFWKACCIGVYQSIDLLIATFSVHLAKPAGCWFWGFLGLLLLLMLSLLKISITFLFLHSQFEYLVTDHLVCLCASSVDFLLSCSFELVNEYQLVLMPHRRN